MNTKERATITTCEMCGKDSADQKGYCMECDYTTEGRAMHKENYKRVTDKRRGLFQILCCDGLEIIDLERFESLKAREKAIKEYRELAKKEGR